MRALSAIWRFTKRLIYRTWLWLTPSPEQEALAKQIRNDQSLSTRTLADSRTPGPRLRF